MSVQITIRWGRDYGDGEELPEETYTFETRDEANAFMLGVDEAEGWAGYSLIHDGRDSPPEVWEEG